MFKKKFTKLTACIMAVLLAATTMSFDSTVMAATSSSTSSSVTDLSKVSLKSSVPKYSDYLNTYPDAGYTGEEIVIQASKYSKAEGVTKESNYEGKDAVVTTEEGYIAWDVNVKSSGLYAINVDYYPVEGSGGSIQKTITIDGEIPFSELFGVEFYRVYVDEDKNPSGAEVRPNQIEEPRWINEYVTDTYGYYGDAVYVYLEKGKHTLAFTSLREPMAISEIKLISKDLSPRPYEEVYNEKKASGATEVSGTLENGMIIVQAENAKEKSDTTLFTSNDTTSTKLQPFDYDTRLMNVIGGAQWKYSNQWISWDITVPKSGFYNIGVRVKQNFARDVESNRTLYIDGEIPFEEASNLHFAYDDKWYTQIFGGDTPYAFYLEEGTHEIKLQVTAGDLNEVLVEADDILVSLNAINLDLIELMSITPDTDRDYKIDEYMPETLEQLADIAERLQNIYDNMLARTGGRKDSLTNDLEQLMLVVNNMVETPDRIPSLFSRFRTKVGSFGTWISTVREHSLLLDYIFVSEIGAEVPNKNDNFFERFYAGLRGFINTFTQDQSVLSKADDNSGMEAITVWIGSGLTGGRDQATALNRMITETFTPNSNIAVNLQLVPGDTVLKATLAGRGPDIALQVGQSDPVDYAIRNAVQDLTIFDDFEEVRQRFFSSAMTPFEYDGGVYALPNNITYQMLFYRTDIMEELGIDVEQLRTWNSIIEILPILQGKNMNFGLGSDMNTYAMFLYQMGGDFYTEDSKASALDSYTALEAFKYWTDFFEVYSLVIDYSFQNRFRTGEIPVGISSYTAYNELMIAAPEIKGKWAMIELPGIKQEDGTIINTASTSSDGAIMIKASEHKEAAWEFLKWWTSADVQFEYGKQLEAVMGASARWNTANMEAMQKMSWTAADKKSLMKQAENLHGMRQVPGGYFTERNFNFAKNSVFNDGTDPRETLSEYSMAITEEIEFKRNEFGLD